MEDMVGEEEKGRGVMVWIMGMIRFVGVVVIVGVVKGGIVEEVEEVGNLMGVVGMVGMVGGNNEAYQYPVLHLLNFSSL